MIDALKTAFVHGRLPKTSSTCAWPGRSSRETHAELATLTDDLPAGPIPVAPPRPGALARAGAYVTIVAGLCLVAAISNGNGNPLTVLGGVLFFSPVWLLALAGLLALHAQLDRRAAGQLPPGPEPGEEGPPA